MGLDTVELVMEIEDAFDISIPDDQASKMLTVGDVYEFILEQTADSTLRSSTCLTAVTFYDLRLHLRSLGLSDAAMRMNCLKGFKTDGYCRLHSAIRTEQEDHPNDVKQDYRFCLDGFRNPHPCVQ